MANASIRYGVSLRKRARAVSKEKQARYVCDMCGKTAVKRVGTGVWNCRHCNATYAGGAYTFKTSSGETANRVLTRFISG